MWGIVDNLLDVTGRPPQAFAAWNEYDIVGNGTDVPTWDPNFGLPTAGARVGALIFKTLAGNSWVANTAVHAASTTQTSLLGASTIQCHLIGRALYLVLCDKRHDRRHNSDVSGSIRICCFDHRRRDDGDICCPVFYCACNE